MENKPESLSVDNVKYIREDLTNKPSFDCIESSKLVESLIGQYVIIRSRNEGINAGYLVAADDTGCVIKDARRLWTHKPKKASWYEGVAVSGLSSESKISCKVDLKVIVESYSITACSDVAILSITEHPTYDED